MNITYEGAEKKTMGTWMKEIPPKMVHDKLGLYKGQWLMEEARLIEPTKERTEH